MSKEAMSIGSLTKPPILFRGEYGQWTMRFLRFVRRQELGEEIKQSITKGPIEFYEEIVAQPEHDPPIPVSRTRKSEAALTLAEKRRMDADEQAFDLLLQAIPNEIFTSVDSCKSAKEIWDTIARLLQYIKLGTEMKINNLLQAYEGFKQKEGETLEATYHRLWNLLNNC